MRHCSTLRTQDSAPWCEIAIRFDLLCDSTAIPYTERFLEYSCNKCCNLIGHSEVSISHRDLQVFHRDLQVFHRDLQLSGWGQKSVSLQ